MGSHHFHYLHYNEFLIFHWLHHNNTAVLLQMFDGPSSIHPMPSSIAIMKDDGIYLFIYFLSLLVIKL